MDCSNCHIQRIQPGIRIEQKAVLINYKPCCPEKLNPRKIRKSPFKSEAAPCLAHSQKMQGLPVKKFCDGSNHHTGRTEDRIIVGMCGNAACPHTVFFSFFEQTTPLF